MSVQLSAEPPYRFTFEVSDFSAKILNAAIINETGDLVWEHSGEFLLPYVCTRTKLNRLEKYTFKITLLDENGKTDTAETEFRVGL